MSERACNRSCETGKALITLYNVYTISCKRCHWRGGGWADADGLAKGNVSPSRLQPIISNRWHNESSPRRVLCGALATSYVRAPVYILDARRWNKFIQAYFWLFIIPCWTHITRNLSEVPTTYDKILKTTTKIQDLTSSLRNFFFRA